MEKKEKKEKPVTVHITNHNKFEKGVGAFITNLEHLTIVMDSEGNMKMDASQVPMMPQTEVVKGAKGSDPFVPQTRVVPPLEQKPKRPLPTAEAMNSVCQQTCQDGYWWSNRSWSVVYWIYMIWGYRGSVSDFIVEVAKWPVSKQIKYTCNRDAISKPMKSVAMSLHLKRWKAEGVPDTYRILGEQMNGRLEAIYGNDFDE